MSSKYPGGIIATGADTGYSVFFDGTGDYLQVPSSANLTLGTSDFTIECWVYPTSWDSSLNQSLISGNGTQYGFSFGANQYYPGKLTFGYEGVFTIIEDAILPSINKWSHVACTRSGSTFRVFVNGVQSGSTITYSPDISSPIRNIGANTTSAGYYNGYISNVRVTKGTALYTTTFTPPTNFLVLGTNAQLLTCQSPTILDKSNNAFAITVGGNAAVSDFTPFVGYKGFNPAMGAAAGGVWSIDDAVNYQTNREWPIYDPYFNQTTLLLHGNGANAATNSSFIDSSTNNFAITRNGNTTQGTFTPYSPSGYGYSFNGTSDGIYIPSSTMSGSWVNSNFTWEAWLNFEKKNFWLMGRNNNDTLYFAIDADNRQLNYGSFNGLSFNYTFTSPSHVFEYNKWNHIAFVRDSSVSNTGAMRIFVNGSLIGIGNTGTFGVDNNSFFMNDRIGNSNNMKGNCAGLRITKRALYRDNFIPPERLTAIDDTLLLTCTSNRLEDLGPNKYTVTTITSEGEGNQTLPPVIPFTNYPPTYITPTTYGNFFDGSGDYLTVNSSDSMFPLTDFNMECWVYWNGSTEDYNAIYHNYNDSTNLGFNWLVTSGGYIHVNINGTSNNSTTALVTGRWYHLALVRSGSTVTRYINGIADATTVTIGTAIAATDKNQIGGAPIAGSGRYWSGIISNLRVLNYALYTTNFTPPNGPLTAISGTKLLTCQDSTFKDNSSNNFTISAFGNARPVTSPTPFPANEDKTSYKAAYHPLTHGGSAYFDGTSDYLSIASGSSLNLGTNDFTMDLWWYPTAFSSDGEIFHGTNATFAFYNSSTGGQVDGYIGTGTGGGWNIMNVGSIGVAKINSWNHIAITRSGSTFRTFMNGIPGATATSSSSITSNNTFVGARAGPAGVVASCYISGVRILSGTALYTSAFAPPLAPPTPVTNTSLLLNFTNAGIVDSTSKNVFETVGDAKISTTVSKFGGSSMYFDGTTDWLIARNTPNLQFGGGDFTIELWVYFNESGRQQSLLNKNDYGQWGQWFLYLSSGNAISFGASSANGSADVVNASFGTPIFNAWNHIAVCRSGASFKGYINGVGYTFGTSSSALYTDPYSLRIGANGNSSGAESGTQLNGYIQDIRLTKGVARYTSNFIPQTSVWQNQ